MTCQCAFCSGSLPSLFFPPSETHFIVLILLYSISINTAVYECGIPVTFVDAQGRDVRDGMTIL